MVLADMHGEVSWDVSAAKCYFHGAQPLVSVDVGTYSSVFDNLNRRPRLICTEGHRTSSSTLVLEGSFASYDGCFCFLLLFRLEFLYFGLSRDSELYKVAKA